MVVGEAIVRAVAEELVNEVDSHNLAASLAVALWNLAPSVLGVGILAEDRHRPRRCCVLDQSESMQRHANAAQCLAQHVARKNS